MFCLQTPLNYLCWQVNDMLRWRFGEGIRAWPQSLFVGDTTEFVILLCTSGALWLTIASATLSQPNCSSWQNYTHFMFKLTVLRWTVSLQITYTFFFLFLSFHFKNKILVNLRLDRWTNFNSAYTTKYIYFERA